MHRFFLPAGSFSSDAVLFPPETANQIRRVLRLRDGERVVALKREGRGFLVELTVDDRAVSVPLAATYGNISLPVVLMRSPRFSGTDQEPPIF